MSKSNLKLEHQEHMQLMTSIDHNAFARTIWDDPEKAFKYYEFWEKVKHDADGSAKQQAELEMAGAMAIIVKMREVNSGFYNAQIASQLDSVNDNVIDVEEDTSKIEEILPETTVKETEDSEVKTVSLFDGQEIADKPKHEEVSKAVKKLVREGKEDDALALAKQYFGSGNYTPKKEGIEATPWAEKRMNGWFNTIKENIAEEKASVKTTEAETPAPETDLSEFGKHRPTLSAETKALKDFAEKYVKLATNGTEDAETAEEFSKLFFKERNYSTKQVDVWKRTVTENEDISQLDHFAVLGVPGSLTGELTDNEKSYEQIVESIRKTMKDIQMTKTSLENNETMLDHLEREVWKKYRESILGTSFVDKAGAVYELYTKLHYDDFIEKVVMANFTDLSTQPTKKSGKETTVLEPETIDNITKTIIKNGGILEDTIDNPSYNHLVGEGKEFSTRKELQDTIDSKFNEWALEYKNSITTYPAKEFKRSLDTAFFNEVNLEDFIKEAKDYMVRPDGVVLTLTGYKKADGTKHVINFDTVGIFIDFIRSEWKALGKLKTTNEKDKVEKPKEQTTEPVETVEKDPETKVEDSGVMVKMTYLESICNRAIKKGRDMTAILKDDKISKLVAEGGTLYVNKEISESYDTTAESFDKLRADLQQVFDRLYAKKHPKKVEKQVEEIKAQDNEETPDKTETEEDSNVTVLESDSSAITSISQMKPAGLKLIEAGCSKKELLQWGQDVLLNRKMKEQADSAVFKDAEKIKKFIKGLFGEFFEKEKETKETDGKMTVEHLTGLVKSASTEEGQTYISLCKQVNTICETNNLSLTMGERLDLVRSNASDLYLKHLDNIHEQRKEQLDKVVVPEKISETDTTMWDKIKDFTTLDQVYNTSMELCEAGEWKTALNMTVELISSGSIVEADNWTDEQIGKWFDTNILRKESVAETTEPESTEEPETSDEDNDTVEAIEQDFIDLQNADGGGDFRKALIKIHKKYEDSPELRQKLLLAIRGGKANYARRMAKLLGTKREDKVHKEITSAKAYVDKIKDQPE